MVKQYSSTTVHLFLKWLIAGIALALIPRASSAATLMLPQTLASEALSDSVPTAFALDLLGPEDFALDWQGPAPVGVQVSIESRSIEWVRVSDILVIPRARLWIVADSIEGGTAASGGFTQPLSRQTDDHWNAKIPVALISGDRNPVVVGIRRDGKTSEHSLRIRFKPRRSAPARVYMDTSCSRFGLSSGASESAQEDWVYVGCRLVNSAGEEWRTSSLEVFVFWDNIGQQLEVEGIPTASTSVSVWPLRLRSDPGRIHLKGGARTLDLTYSIPKQLHRGSVSAGLGPYQSTYESEVRSENTTVPILTLYGSYAIHDTLKLVLFDATTFNYTLYTDIGLYLSTESARLLDRRLALNIMLGAHAIGFRSLGRYYGKVGVPQGIELVWYDAFFRGHNFSAGAFIYPKIDGKAYYNAWTRWGVGGFFAEVNYIAWEEFLEEKGRFYSKSLGISLGFPLFQFL